MQPLLLPLLLLKRHERDARPEAFLADSSQDYDCGRKISHQRGYRQHPHWS